MVETGCYATDIFYVTLYRDNTIMPEEIEFEDVLVYPIQANQYSGKDAYRHKYDAASFIIKDVRRHCEKKREFYPFSK